jgi:hypothetical protein
MQAGRYKRPMPYFRLTPHVDTLNENMHARVECQYKCRRRRSRTCSIWTTARELPGRTSIDPTQIAVSGQRSSVGRVEAPASQARAAWVPSKPVLHRAPTDDCSQLTVAARRTALPNERVTGIADLGLGRDTGLTRWTWRSGFDGESISHRRTTYLDGCRPRFRVSPDFL